MEGLIVQLGVGGIFAIMVLQTVFGFLKGRGEAKELSDGKSDTKMQLQLDAHVKKCVSCEVHIDDLIRMTRDLHQWHNVSDRDGVKVWYVRSSLGDAIERLSESLNKMTSILEEIVRSQDRTVERLEKMDAKIDQFKENTIPPGTISPLRDPTVKS